MTASTKQANSLYMAGTEGTGEYQVTHTSRRGRVGFRELGIERMRVRVEPSSPKAAAKMAKHLTPEAGWKQPGDGGQDRFSIVANTNAEAFAAIQLARKALGWRGRKYVRGSLASSN